MSRPSGGGRLATRIACRSGRFGILLAGGGSVLTGLRRGGRLGVALRVKSDRTPDLRQADRAHSVAQLGVESAQRLRADAGRGRLEGVGALSLGRLLEDFSLDDLARDDLVFSILPEVLVRGGVVTQT